MAKNDILNFTLTQLLGEMKRIGEPPYRSKQIFYWLYKKGLRSFNEMVNMPEFLRSKLEENYRIGTLDLAERLKSLDGTEKFLFKLKDGSFIESVLIYSKERKTICISTQVGCKYRCVFCRSGLRGFMRNLDTSEILNQILFLGRNLKHKITNFVFMGMGEPLDNYENVSRTVLIMTEPEGMGIAAKRITVSTCGIIPGIKALQTLKKGINLSVSLHAADDTLRNSLMPINKKYPLNELIKVCADFAEKAKGDVTFEYVLIKGKNDSAEDAGKLSKLAARLPAKINLLVYSPVSQLALKPPAERDVKTFIKILESKKIKVTLRRSKGADIAAACGQLAGKAWDYANSYEI